MAGTTLGMDLGLGAAGTAAAASPAMDSFSPTSGGANGQRIDVYLSDMPSGFTLNDIKVNSASLFGVTKDSDGQVHGSTMGTTSGLVVVEFNGTESVDSSGLSPASYTVV